MNDQAQLTAFVFVVALTAFGSGMFLTMGRRGDALLYFAVCTLFTIVVIAGIWL